MKKRWVAGLLACAAAAWACAEDDSFVEDASVERDCAVYVDGEAVPGGDGLSPETAYATIDEAMEGARAMKDSCDGNCEVRLAEGMLDENAFQLLSRSVAGSGLTIRKWQMPGDLAAIEPASVHETRSRTSGSTRASDQRQVFPGIVTDQIPVSRVDSLVFEDEQALFPRTDITDGILDIQGNDPWLRLNHSTSTYVDWVFHNVDGNLQVRKSGAGGDVGDRIIIRDNTSPSSAVDILGFENNGFSSGYGVLRLRSVVGEINQAMVMDGNEIDSWSDGSGGTLYLNYNAQANVAMCARGGSVTIGTTSTAGYMLSVNGDIRAKEVVVTTEGWSDDVFDEDYRLQSLPEVESYIAANGHLPGVPSAGEALEKGVPVGEIQSILLRKVEELTLHAIEQGKRLDALAADNERLRQELAGRGKGNGR